MRIHFSRGELSSLLPNPHSNRRMTVESFRTQLSSLYLFRDSSFSVRFFSSSCNDLKRRAFTVSYLMKSCGLLPCSAFSVSKKLHLETPERPDSVLSLLRNHGISSTHLPKIIRVYPNLLLTDPNKTLLPKLQFFTSKPFSKEDVVKILFSCPMILSRSLERQIIPSYYLMRSILGLDERVVSVFKHSPRVFLDDMNKNLVPNIAILQEIGVPRSSIVYLVTTYPGAVVQVKKDRFTEIVKEVMEMGFDPTKQAFVRAIKPLSGMTKSTWEKKMEIYRNWGWSNDEILLLFKASPMCMCLSGEKIMSTMNFLVNKMGWERTEITRVPAILDYNLENRIIPRCSVGKVLMMKGLVKKDMRLHTLLKYSEQKFLDRFVTKHQNEIPQLLNLYQGDVAISDLV